jgi:hypothetical protein
MKNQKQFSNIKIEMLNKLFVFKSKKVADCVPIMVVDEHAIYSIHNGTFFRFAKINLIGEVNLR